MKFVIAKSELMQLINKIQTIVGKSSATVPILSNFLLEAKGGEIILTATDLTVGLRCQGSAKIIEEGVTTLPARTFFQLVREITAENIEITTNDNEISTISAGSSLFKLHGMSKDEFPRLPDLTDATKFTVDGAALREGVYRTSYAVSKEDSRYMLTGVLLEVSDGKASFVATDAKRLAKATASIVIGDKSFKARHVLPVKAVDEIIRIVDDTAQATVYLMQDRIAIESGQSLLITKLLSEDFPDYTRIIPDQSDANISLHREELVSLLRQMSLFSDDPTDPICFCFTAGELILKTNNMRVGEGTVSMPIDYHKEKITISLSPHFFLDVLKHTKDETVNFALTDSYNPGMITDSTNSIAVLMPLRLQQEE
ncbi:DNA polymerase III subunit beta [Simkania negevensis]|uniref:Beta sliding clamp n=1 Tax=Simkania negevensis TaxID=83561 RepID=A0ABS3ASI5_9BACT|nr:DNA polymerase III subunit beta [Simkania negevensis]